MCSRECCIFIKCWIYIAHCLRWPCTDYIINVSKWLIIAFQLLTVILLIRLAVTKNDYLHPFRRFSPYCFHTSSSENEDATMNGAKWSALNFIYSSELHHQPTIPTPVIYCIALKRKEAKEKGKFWLQNWLMYYYFFQQKNINYHHEWN